MPTEPKPGEVWFAELGMVEKSRPVLVLAFPDSEDARALAVVAPLTSQIRGMRGEVDLGKPRWLPQQGNGLRARDCGKLPHGTPGFPDDSCSGSSRRSPAGLHPSNTSSFHQNTSADECC